MSDESKSYDSYEDFLEKSYPPKEKEIIKKDLEFFEIGKALAHEAFKQYEDHVKSNGRQ